jgi:hypothetical protein
MEDQRNVLMRKKNSVLRTVCYKTADITAFHSTCWKESNAAMQPITHIKHFSTASKPLAYYEQLSYHKLLQENFGNQTIPPHPRLLSVRVFPYTP